MPRGASARVGLVGLTLLLALGVLAVFAPGVSPHDPFVTSGSLLQAPTAAHPLGTNDIGQDILSELIWGTRVSLGVGLFVAITSTVIGAGVGAIAGHRRGFVDQAAMRVADVVLALPLLPLALLVGAYAGRSYALLGLLLGALLWARPARVVRAHVLSERDYVLAARALGASDGHIIARHIVPSILPLAIAQFVIAAGGAILLETSLSFLGMGDPLQKSWGTMLYFAQLRSAFLTGAWVWWVLPPGLLISATVTSFALIGLALEERLDARLRD